MDPSTYRLYIDESGDHSFKCMDGLRRYLALMGVWFDTGKPYNSFVDQLRALKDDIFGLRPDDPVILHREDILNRRGPFYRLRDPAIAARFDAGLLDLVKAASFKICCVVIDKQTHEEKTYRNVYDPYEYCLSALLERYAGLLERIHATGDVLAESRGKTEDQQLKKAFTGIYNGGTAFTPAALFQRVLTSKEIKLKKKTHCIAGLELADILASPVRRQIVAERSGEAVPVDFGRRLTEAIEGKFNCRLFTGQQVDGYGKVWLD